MACILYKEGKGTIEHGIECESTTCEIEHLEGLLASGWFQTPPGYEPPEAVIKEEPDSDEEDEVPDGDVIASMKAEIDSLDEQVRILTEMSEVSAAEVERLNGELATAVSENEVKDAEISRLGALIAPAVEEDPVEEEVKEEDGSHLNPVRVAAREAGIEGWDTKRIATLEKMLEA